MLTPTINVEFGAQVEAPTDRRVCLCGHTDVPAAKAQPGDLKKVAPMI